jgi:hypothetical protein
VTWVLGVVVVVVIGAAVVWIFVARGAGPFVGLSRQPGAEGKITTSRSRTDFQDDLRKPRNENELL